MNERKKRNGRKVVLEIGEVVPGFGLRDVEGHLVSLADFSGQVVVLYFWSAECPWVERADRAMAGLAGQAAVLAVSANANEPVELVRRVAGERGVRVLLDPGGKTADRFEAQTTPHFFVIDGEERLRYRGALDDVTFRLRVPTRNYVQEVVEALRAGRLVAVAETPAYGCSIIRCV